MSSGKIAEGPYFDELHVGQVFENAPGLTLTEGLAAAHRSIVGDRLPLSLDAALCSDITGRGLLASPALVCDVAIGQSTVVTQHVKANLFYRGLVFRRLPEIGDTLRTTTEVVSLRQNKPREGRRPTGLAALRIVTVDQRDRAVLDFWRCAMLSLRDDRLQTGHADDLDAIGVAADPAGFHRMVADWRVDAHDRRLRGPRFGELEIGDSWRVGGGDVVSDAPALARLTLNLASVHHDRAAAAGERLVYGGHTIGLALAQASRVLPSILTVAAWHGCDHLGPVHEGDTLRSSLTVRDLEPLAGGGGLVHLRSQVTADGEPQRDVLDWRYAVLLP